MHTPLSNILQEAPEMNSSPVKQEQVRLSAKIHIEWSDINKEKFVMDAMNNYHAIPRKGSTTWKNMATDTDEEENKTNRALRMECS